MFLLYWFMRTAQKYATNWLKVRRDSFPLRRIFSMGISIYFIYLFIYFFKRMLKLQLSLWFLEANGRSSFPLKVRACNWVAESIPCNLGQQPYKGSKKRDAQRNISGNISCNFWGNIAISGKFSVVCRQFGKARLDTCMTIDQLILWPALQWYHTFLQRQKMCHGEFKWVAWIWST